MGLADKHGQIFRPPLTYTANGLTQPVCFCLQFLSRPRPADPKCADAVAKEEGASRSLSSSQHPGARRNEDDEDHHRYEGEGVVDDDDDY